MKLPVRNAEGEELRRLTVDDSVFGIEPNGAVLHQAFVAQRANQRWGTAQTRTRGEVQGSTRKIRMQKYTGRARQGSARAPHRVGGGVAFGPRQRDYSQALPKKMRRLAIRSALSGKVSDGQLVVIDGLALERPKTREIQRILRNVGIERSALIVTGQPDRTVLASVRNLQRTKVLPAAYLNVLDMLTHRDLLMTEEAVRVAEGLWGQKGAVSAPAQKAEPKRRRPVKDEAVAVGAPAAGAAALPEEAPSRAKGRRAVARAEEAPAAGKPRRSRPPAAEAAALPEEAPSRAKGRRAVARAEEAPASGKPRRSRPPAAEAAALPEEAPSRAKGRRAVARTEEAPASGKPRRSRPPAASAQESSGGEPKPRRQARKAEPREGEA